MMESEFEEELTARKRVLGTFEEYGKPRTKSVQKEWKNQQR